MKTKIFIVVSFIIVSISCKQEIPNYAIISGQLENEEKITIYYNERTIEVLVDKNGEFRDTIPVKKLRYCSYDSKHTFPFNFYISPGAEITINGDVKNLKESIVFSGTLKNLNTYISKQQFNSVKHTFEYAERYKMFKLDEKAFLEALAKEEQAENELLESYPSSMKNQSQNIIRVNNKYASYNKKISYYNQHANLINNKDYQFSEGFMNDIEALNMDDSITFCKSYKYKDLVLSRYQYDLEKTSDTDTYSSIKFIEESSRFKSNNIKTYVLNFAKSMYLDDDNQNYNEVYNTLMKHSTSVQSKKAITEEYKRIDQYLKRVAKGQKSADFNYENYNGGTTSLDDLKGKNVYIDLWATWCKPCVAEIPYLEKLQEEYKDKNIEFVSITLDTEKDKWKSMITDRQMKGIQLIADKNFKSDFIKHYQISGIPRFILLDTQGNIVSPNAPRPSYTNELKSLLNTLPL